MTGRDEKARGSTRRVLIGLVLGLAVGSAFAAIDLIVHATLFGPAHPFDAKSVWSSLLVFAVTTSGTYAYLRLRQTLEQLATREEQYRALAEAAHDIVFLIAPDDTVLYVNAFAAQMYGRPREKIVGRRRSELFPPVVAEQQRRSLNRVFETGEPLYREDKTPFAGRDSWQGTWLVPLKQKDGRVYAVMGVGRDITEQRLAQEAVLESEKRLKRITSLLGEGVFVVDGAGKFSFVNPATEQLLGREEAELIGLDCREVIHAAGPRGEAVEGESPLMGVLESGVGLRTEELSCTRKDGSSFPASCLAEPLREHGEVIGVVASFQDISERKQRETLDRAIERISEVAHSSLQVESVIQRVLVEAVKAMACDRGAVILREDNEWLVRHYYGPEPDLSGTRFPDEQVNMLAEAARTAKPVVVVEEAETDKRVDPELVRRYGIGSFMLVPLRFPRELVGGIALDRCTPGRFSDAEIDFARGLSSAVSLAIENARHYERQREIAEALQASLATPPAKLAGLDIGVVYKSASEAARVGGDFFDVFQTAGGLLAVVVGDVAGAGIEAAGRTEIVKSSIRALALVNPSPAFILTKTNAALLLRGEAQFVTVALLMVDRPSRRMTIASAGHPPPLLLGKDCRYLGVAQGLPLGVMEYEYEDQQVELPGVESVLLYTDGVTEARRRREFFEEERLFDVACGEKSESSQAIADAVWEAVNDFTSGSLRDDLAVVCLKVP